MSVKGAKDICIELNSMSKSHNMPGWRIGLLASNAQFVEWVLKVKSNIDSGMFRPMQLAAVEALKNPVEWHESMNKIYRKRRDLAGQIMDEMDCVYDPKQVGLFLWGKISDKWKNGEELSNKMLYDGNVFITPGFIFGSNGDRYVRLSLCASEEKLTEALERIKKLE